MKNSPREEQILKHIRTQRGGTTTTIKVAKALRITEQNASGLLSHMKSKDILTASSMPRGKMFLWTLVKEPLVLIQSEPRLSAIDRLQMAMNDVIAENKKIRNKLDQVLSAAK